MPNQQRISEVMIVLENSGANDNTLMKWNRRTMMWNFSGPTYLEWVYAKKKEMRLHSL